MQLSSVDLAGAVGADDRDDLARRNRERDAEQRLEVAVERIERRALRAAAQASAGIPM